MFPGLLQHDVWKSVFGITRWNQYVSNWPVVLRALRRLWEIKKVSEFKTPFYESFEKLAKP